MADLTRVRDLSKKKVKSFFAATFTEGRDGVTAASANHLLAKLPRGCLVTTAYVFTHTVSDAATSAAITLGTTSGGTQIMSAGNLKTAGKTGTASAMIDTGTGVDLWMNLTFSGAAADVAKYAVVVEYMEPAKASGDLTDVTRL